LIRLVDLLNASGFAFNADSTKVHLACWNGQDRPIDVYYAGKFQAWQEHQTKRNFACDHILSLIDIGPGRWLFVGIYDVLGYSPHSVYPGQFLYTTQLRPTLEDLIGRVIVAHSRTRQSYVWLKPEVQLPVLEIRSQKMTIGDFPGYNSVLIRHSILRVITQQVISSWHAALKSIRGVYLVTDTYTGKQYVGKASGEVGIWQRWCDYAANGHGGNVKLKVLLEEMGSQYVNHFQYSILEIADTHASEQQILARESYWMNVLRTREFGLN